LDLRLDALLNKIFMKFGACSGLGATASVGTCDLLFSGAGMGDTSVELASRVKTAIMSGFTDRVCLARVMAT
jgi:hypothetical protein